MYFDKHGTGKYFDNYGLDPGVNGFTAFMERNSNDWVYNNNTVQSLLSRTCGHYCEYFILYHCRGHSMRDIVSRFSLNLIENDRNIDLFIRTF